VVLAVYHGRFDIGSVREGTLELVSDKVDLGQIRVLGYTPWYPGWMYSARKGLAPEIVNNIREALLKLNCLDTQHRSICDAAHFAGVIEAIKQKLAGKCPRIEVLIPDFQGDEDALRTVIAAHPDVINHNIETVPRLYAEVRPQAVYQRSLTLLSRVKDIDPSRYTKSGIMVGLGETKEEVLSVFADLRRHGCDFLTIGQYLAPSSKHHPLIEYITPEQFAWYKEQADLAGFLYTASGPLVRSSYHAEEALQNTPSQK
jgi:lipoate synthase